MIGSLIPFLQGGGRAFGSLASRLLASSAARGMANRGLGGTDLALSYAPPIEMMDREPDTQVPNIYQTTPYNVGSIPFDFSVYSDPTPMPPDPNLFNPTPWHKRKSFLNDEEDTVGVPASFDDLQKLYGVVQKPSDAEPSETQPSAQRQRGMPVPDRGTIGERVTDKIFDFLRGYGQSKSYGEGLARGVQAMTEGAQQRESAYRQKQAYMEQGFTEAQAEAMIRDAKYRDKMIEQQTKLQSLEAGRLGKDMEWTRDEQGNINGQRVIKGSPTYMKLKSEYDLDMKALNNVKDQFKLIKSTVARIKTILGGGYTIHDAVDSALAYTPLTGVVAKWIGKNFPKTPQGQLYMALESLKTHVMFGQIQNMRNSSRTQATGLGQITHKELDELKASLGYIDQSAGDEAIQAVTDQIINHLTSIHQRAEDNIRSRHPDFYVPQQDTETGGFSAAQFLLNPSAQQTQQSAPEPMNTGMVNMSYNEAVQAAKNDKLSGVKVVFDEKTGKYYEVVE